MLRKYSSLFFSFFKIGLFTFGSGYAMITLLKKEIVENRGWMSERNIADIIAIGESTPGSISVSSATFIGYRVGGFLGAIIATLGIISPSVIIMSIVSFFMKEFAANVYVDYAFAGVRCAVLVLIINATALLFKEMGKYYLNYIVMVVSFLLLVVFKVNVMTLLMAAMLVSAIAFRFIPEDER
ncbi:MAG: chromate transporter [Erysipelotrichaceae bacterium]|nr:chromate transporter [Erysipelotrichaceae bacterium]MBR3005876.1 chromate transporter [Erysipelotrichaceae bacterium]MBR6232343.1 chromate transporter [Erysipelotrichaceae bacterium]